MPAPVPLLAPDTPRVVLDGGLLPTSLHRARPRCTHPSDSFVGTAASLNQIAREEGSSTTKSGSAVHSHRAPIGKCMFHGGCAGLQLPLCRRCEIRHRQVDFS